MFKQAEEGERIKYADVCSLYVWKTSLSNHDSISSYPWVQKYGRYPVGGRRIKPGHELENVIVTAEQLRRNCEGFLSCRVSFRF